MDRPKEASRDESRAMLAGGHGTGLVSLNRRLALAEDDRPKKPFLLS